MPMSFAEILARLLTALVGWLCLYAYMIWLATVRVVSCATDGNTLWAVLLGFGCFAAPLAWLLNLTRPLHDVHAILRHFAWPLLLLLPLAVPPVYTAWIGSTLADAPLCIDTVAEAWHAWWAPLQTALLIFMGWSVFRAVHVQTGVPPEGQPD